MSHSLTGHSIGRILSGLIRKRGLAHIATILAFAMVGLTSGARAVPVTCSDWSWSSGGHDLRNTRPLLPRARPGETVAAQPTSVADHCLHPFIGVEVGGGWSNANFAVAPPFNVTGSSFIGGINGGVLIDIPGTNFSVGPRIGWQGGNMSGSTFYPPTGFTYAVDNRSVFYQDLMGQIRVQPFGIITPNRYPGLNFSDVFLRGSVGIAEVHTQVTGTSGAFQVTDSVTRTGFTGTVGIGVPISAAFLGGNLDAYTQYRFIDVPSTTVSIPGLVQIDDRWVQSIAFGVAFRY
jgi:hypothetical protein